MPKERPILFSGPMIRAILEGRKTQTRRLTRKPRVYPTSVYEGIIDGYHQWYESRGGLVYCRKCPFGVPGDRLWVREAWATRHEWDHMKPSGLPADADLWWRADKSSYRALNAKPGKWRPSIHMPKKFARIWLEITGERPEQLQEISAKDIIAEGVPLGALHGQPDFQHVARGGSAAIAARFPLLLEISFAVYWDKLNAKRGHPWSANDWVWVVGFSKV